VAQPGSGRFDQWPEREPPDLADTEGLRNGQRAVGEVGFRGDELDREAVLGERAQRQVASSAATPPPAIRTRV